MKRTKTHSAAILLVLVVACAALTGCATNRKEMMQFLATAQTSIGGEHYKVMPPDVISITARPTEEYDGLMVQIGPDGRAFLPLIGSYQIAGKTTSQIAAELTENLQDYYQDVQVTVSVEHYRSQRYYVFGEVSRPGMYPYTGTDSVISALSVAGPTRLAEPESVTIIRGLAPIPGQRGVEVDQNGEIVGNVQRIRVNLWEMARDGQLDGNLALANNDVIYVPAHPLAKVGLALQSVLFPISPMVETVGSPYDFSDAARGTE